MKKIGLGLLVVLIVIQFFRIDKTNPPSDPKADFIAMSNPSEEVSLILKGACYDCHSDQTEYPWYTNVAPLSWWIKEHINDGRRHLNFSKWGEYTAKRQDHKLEEVGEEVKEGEMPLASYTWVHGEARLSKEQQKALVDWVTQYRKHSVN